MTDSPERIVVRVTNWIGDALMNTPALAALRRRYPDAHIAIIAKSYVAPLFEHNPAVDQVITYDAAKGLSRVGPFLRAVSTIRQGGFDLGIAFQNAFEAAFLMAAGGVRRRVGYARDGRTMLLTDPQVLTPDLREVHETRYYLHLVQALGSAEQDPDAYVLNLTELEMAWAERFLREQGLRPDKPIIAINPGATYGSAKRWHPGRFARVADALADQYDAEIVIIGTKGEYSTAIEIKTGMVGNPHILSGKTTLRQLAAVLDRCSLLLTNDSGAMHVACAVGLPLVAIFGSTDPKTTHPWGVPYRLVREPVECSPCLLRECPIDHRCMERVTVDKVLDTAGNFIDEVFTTGQPTD